MIRLLSKIPERRGEVIISQERTSAFFNRASPIDFTAQSPSNFRWYISLRHFLLAAGEPSARPLPHNPANTLSAVTGRSVMGTPTASNTALAMAPDTGMLLHSPMPFFYQGAGLASPWISTVSVDGAAAEVSSGVSEVTLVSQVNLPPPVRLGKLCHIRSQPGRPLLG